MKNEKINLVELVKLMEIAYLESYTYVSERLSHPFSSNYEMVVKCKTEEGMCYKLYSLMDEKFNINDWEEIEKSTDNLIDKILQYFNIAEYVDKIPVNIKNLYKYKNKSNEEKNILLMNCLKVRLGMLSRYYSVISAIK